ncbi:hypothetical protein AB0L20_31885 [Streptomyces albidoflavus]|uniref:hypothetical protein n=1 Tax=Streptomyces albidoflavus TaxID=1886 RepID=UPI003435132F
MAAALSKVTPELMPQYEALLLDHRSVRKLADETLNHETVVSEDNAVQLLELMRQATSEEERTKRREEVNALNRKRTAERKASKEVTERLSNELQEARDALKLAEIHSSNQFDRAIERTNRVSLWIERAFLAITGMLVAFWVVDYFVPWLSLHLWGRVAIALVAALSTYHLVMDALQKPKRFGLVTALNWLSKTLLALRLAHMNLHPPQDLAEVAFVDVRAVRKVNRETEKNIDRQTNET